MARSILDTNIDLSALANHRGSPAMTFEVEGLSDLLKNLQQLPEKLQGRVLRGAVNAGAAVIEKQAVANAPTYTGHVGKGHQPPGTLKRAIYRKFIKEESGLMQIIFYIGVRSGKREQKKNRDAFYWRWVEFGTKKMAARPFLRPAFESRKEEAARKLKAYLEKRIEKEANK